MSRKSKGTGAERELFKNFWAHGWAAIRSAGSGSTPFPSPDILVGNKIRRLAIEVKATKEEKKYFPKEEIRQLKNFSGYFGAEPWLAIKIDRKGWFFVNPEDLAETESSFVFNMKDAERIGLSFEELVHTNIHEL